MSAAGVLLVLGGSAQAEHDKGKSKSKDRCKAPARPALEPQGYAAGIYTDASVAMQLSSFTLSRGLVTCGVGPLGLGTSSGPFAMLMYARMPAEFVVSKGMLTSRGKMRSITRLGGMTEEDVVHAFIAEAAVGPPARFDVHFKTPFWDPATNPMATPSSKYPGLARFGGAIVVDGNGVPMGVVTTTG